MRRLARLGEFPCGVVRRHDRAQITVLALNPPFELQPGQNRRVPEMLAELNEELTHARGWTEPPPSGARGDPASPPPHPTARGLTSRAIRAVRYSAVLSPKGRQSSPGLPGPGRGDARGVTDLRNFRTIRPKAFARAADSDGKGMQLHPGR